MHLTTDERPVPTIPDVSLPSGGALITPAELERIALSFASSGDWIDRVRLRSQGRWYERLYQSADYDLWVISWLPGQSTDFHDHGKSSGAFVVASGVLEEHRAGEQILVIPPGKSRAFGANYAHDVRNVSVAPAVSIHAYSPPLQEMNEYELDGVHLISRPPSSASRRRAADPAIASGIEQVLCAARLRLRRLSPGEAYEAVNEKAAILVDIRPESQRAFEGGIPGAVVVERNVLEWRFDPSSSSRLPIATGHDIQVIVFCSEGYTSSLAAAALQDVGLWRATDLVGGFQAWREAGLPSAQSVPAS